MKYQLHLPICLMLFVAGMTSIVAAAEDDAVKVFKIIRPAVVSIESDEGAGTGIIIDDDKGLILTNAHVAISPLPMRVKVEVGADQEELFGATVIGYHPTLDLAVLKIDSGKRRLKLTQAKFSKQKASPGEQIYVIGNPGGAGEVALTKSITAGMISGVDRVIDGASYYQTDAAINPGNSGGPMCDKKGQVVGIVTLKIVQAEAIGFAIPVTNIDPSKFVPITERKTDPARALELIKMGERLGALADQAYKDEGEKSERRKAFNYYAAVCYREAVLNNPLDPVAYYNTGMFLRTLDEFKVAGGYLVRSIQLNPWDETNGGNPYRELGLVLANQNRVGEAVLTWNEGLAKFPYEGKIYEDIAITDMQTSSFPAAVKAASMALLIGGDDIRKDVMQSVVREAMAKLSGDVRESTQRAIEPAALARESDKLLAASNQARKKRTMYIDDNFATIVKGIGGAEIPGVADKISPKPLTRSPALARYKPEAPGKPDAPAKPETTAKTDAPAKPDAPNKTDVPGKTDAPGKTDTSVKTDDKEDGGDWIADDAKGTKKDGTAADGASSPAIMKILAETVDEDLAEKPRVVNEDATVRAIKVDAPLDLAFSTDAKWAFVVSKTGLINRLSIPAMRCDRRINLAHPCVGLARCKLGLLLATKTGVILLDDELKVLKSFDAPHPQGIASSPKIDWAYLDLGGSIRSLNVSTGDMFDQTSVQLEQKQNVDRPLNAGFDHLRMTPDARFLFGIGGTEQLVRMRVDGKEIDVEELSDRIAQNGQDICVSSDSRYVSLPSGGGNYPVDGIDQYGYKTYLYRVGELKRPAIVITTGAYPKAIGFDATTKRIYAQNTGESLKVFSPAGLELKKYSKKDFGVDPDRFYVVPTGGKLFALDNDKLIFIELQ